MYTDSGGAPTGLIVGLVVGSVILIVIIGIIILCIRQNKKKQRNVRMAYTVNEGRATTIPDETKPWLCDVMEKPTDEHDEEDPKTYQNKRC